VVGQLAATAAAAGVNVALSGEGADEMFFGYDHYMAVVARMNPAFSWLGQRYSLRGAYAAALDKGDAALTDIFLGGGANIDWDNARRDVFGPGAEGTRSVREFVIDLARETSASGAAPADIDQQLIYIDYAQKVPENLLRRAEGPSMGRGVEMRFPFLSDELVRLMYRLPMAQRIGDGSTKYLLRRLMAGLLPVAALNRPKSPFGLPAARREHFKGAGLDFRQPAFRELFHRYLERVRGAILDGAFAREQMFNRDFVERLLAAQKDRETCVFDGSLWKLWNIAEWYEQQIR
jgi:asparagine synthetase B (glutamine-hydrolysing)